MTGKVIKKEANFYSVVFDNKEYLCTRRANLKKAGKKIKVGDSVELESLNAERPVITNIKNRKNELSKPPISNISQTIIVMSAKQPDFNTRLVDRFLILTQYHQIKPLLCINKSDLCKQKLKEKIQQNYPSHAHNIIFVSAESGEGIPELKDHMVEKTSVLTGPSGVGKSSLINRIHPGLQLVTNSVNEKLGVGKHTTRHVALHSINFHDKVGWIADSPGFGNLELPGDIEPIELAFYYPEYKPFINDCKFSNCLHASEMECGVKANNDLGLERYRNYLEILAEIEEIHKQRKYEISTKKEKLLKKKSAGKSKQLDLLKLGTEGRDTNRKKKRQDVGDLEHWANLDPEWLEELDYE